MQKTRILFLGLTLVLFSSVAAFAQEALVVDVVDGLNFTLTETIEGDTTATGARVHTSYILKRGGRYLLSGRIRNIGYDLTLLGEEEPSNVAPPIVMLATDQSGTSDGRLFEPSGNFTAKNIYFMVTDDQGADGKYLVQTATAGLKIKLDNCVSEFGDFGIRVTGKDCSIFVTNCVIRNQMELQIKDTPFHFFIHTMKVPSDTIWIENNTFMNIGAAPFAVGDNSLNKFFLFNHNTMVNSGLQTFHYYGWVNAKVTNNIFYNVLASGDPLAERAKQLGDNGKVPFAVFGIDTLNNPDIPEASRIVKLSNNNYIVDPAIVQMWDANSTITGHGAFLENVRGGAMFADDATWPGLDFDAATLYAVDPGFKTLPDNLSNFIIWAQKMILKPYPTDSPEWIWDDPTNFLNVTWPLPEDFSYSNSSLQTAAENGFPLGDLNWFPAKKAEWLNPTDVTDIENIPAGFSLEQNYPNPFNPATTISFSLPKNSNVKLTVYNLLGQVVAKLIDKELNAGTHSYNYDASRLSSGLYFYTLSADGSTMTKKMMLMK